MSFSYGLGVSRARDSAMQLNAWGCGSTTEMAHVLVFPAPTRGGAGTAPY